MEEQWNSVLKIWTKDEASIFNINFVPLTAASIMMRVTLFRNGNARKPYPSVRTPGDYDNPVNDIVPANPSKGVRISSPCLFVFIPL